jgi:hypothetical protein
VPNSIPILHFGDVEAYAKSEPKIITVGLNPSLAEFSENEDRFGHEVRQSLNPATLRQALSNYFRINPYRRWFNRSYETFLQHFGASFYGKEYPISLNTALHFPPVLVGQPAHRPHGF